MYSTWEIPAIEGTRGNNIETTIGPGDSGSPSFLSDFNTLNPILGADGQPIVYGINTFSGRRFSRLRVDLWRDAGIALCDLDRLGDQPGAGAVDKSFAGRGWRLVPRGSPDGLPANAGSRRCS